MTKPNETRPEDCPEPPECLTNHMYYDEDRPGWWRRWADDGETICPECGVRLADTREGPDSE